MPHESRKPMKNKKLKTPIPENISIIKYCWDACERFVFLGAISLGLLQIIALKYNDSVWSEFDEFLRTRSREIPSERTVKSVISRKLKIDYISFAPSGILRKIRKRYLQN